MWNVTLILSFQTVNTNGTNYTHQLLWTRLLTTALERHQAILSNEVYICRKNKFSSKGLDDVYMRPKIKFPLAMKKSLFTSLFIAVVGMKGLIKNVNKPERYIEASWHFGGNNTGIYWRVFSLNWHSNW